MSTKEKVNNEPIKEPQTVEKPVAILMQELEEKVVGAIQSSGLHINIISNYFQKLTAQLVQLEEENRKQEIEQYNAQIQALDHKE